MSANGWVHLENCIILRVTDKALLVRVDGGSPTWLPKSQIGGPNHYRVGDSGIRISITEWLAEQKRLDDGRDRAGGLDESLVNSWYRGLCLTYHPDRGGSVEAMQAINDANERLRAAIANSK